MWLEPVANTSATLRSVPSLSCGGVVVDGGGSSIDVDGGSVVVDGVVGGSGDAGSSG